MKLKDQCGAMYRKVKLMLYRSMFKTMSKQNDGLTSSEFFCLECIYLLDKPTISEFAKFLDISSPNATYKVKTLIKKGLIQKEKSPRDGREYLLVPTQKFFDLYENKSDEVNISALKKNLDKNETKKFEKIMHILTEKN